MADIWGTGTAFERRGWAQRIAGALAAVLAAEQERWFLWLPVLLAFGVASYFGLPREPHFWALAALAIALAAAAWRARTNLLAHLVLVCLATLVAGMAVAKQRADAQRAPLLNRDLPGTYIKGWIEEVDPRSGGLSRLTIRVASISRLEKEKTPYRVLVSLRKPCPLDLCQPGRPIGLLAFLRPLPGAVMPGAFDYARQAYFDRIGATGFAPRLPEPWLDAPNPHFSIHIAASIETMRQTIAARIQSTLPADTGAIAVALLTGLRGGISDEPLNALRIAGLAHVLAISGLHMSLMAGSLFWLLRALMALSPPATLRLPIKKIAAAAALAGAAFYLVLSGASISTQRAFIMIAIMFAAILCGRPALTMRNLALAAIVVIVLRPESILSASFQMSFAATLGLIAAYERHSSRAEREVPVLSAWPWPLRQALFYFAALCLTTIVASAATAPFAAFHFNRLAPFSIVGNLLAMPIVGFVVMPAGLAALVALPFGLEPIPLSVMGWGIDRLVSVAAYVAILPGADAHVAQMPLVSLVLIVTGCLWLVIWRQRWRFAAVVPVLAALPVASLQHAPDILVDASARAVAVRRADTGRLDIFDNSRAQFTAQRWLAADGDARASGPVEAERFSCDERACVAPLPRGGTIAIVRHRAALAEECATARIVVVTFALQGRCDGPQLVLDADMLRRHGAHAIWSGENGLSHRSVHPRPGTRPWWPDPNAKPAAPTADDEPAT